MALVLSAVSACFSGSDGGGGGDNTSPRIALPTAPGAGVDGARGGGMPSLDDDDAPSPPGPSDPETCSPGDQRPCEVYLDPRNCFVGVQWCVHGRWSACEEAEPDDEDGVDPSAPGEGGMHGG
ncbi:MAG: hypothetical protein AAF928_15495 [Myxococcota bacterium]